MQFISIFMLTHDFNPMIPAECKLVEVNVSIAILIENIEDLLEFFFFQRVDSSTVISE